MSARVALQELPDKMFLPRVLEDGSLEFDPRCPVPKELPHFTVHPEYPNRFIPQFCDCKYRGETWRKLTSCNTCTRLRKVWYCNKFKEEIFPITCSNCTVEDKQ